MKMKPTVEDEIRSIINGDSHYIAAQKRKNQRHFDTEAQQTLKEMVKNSRSCMEDLKCSNCKFYKKWNEAQGHCRRNPPQALSGNQWASVQDTDWCGEFVNIKSRASML